MNGVCWPLQVHGLARRPVGSQLLSAKLTASAQFQPKESDVGQQVCTAAGLRIKTEGRGTAV